MTSAVIEDMPVRTSVQQLSSHPDVKSIVTAFYDAPTGTIQYIVTDPNTRLGRSTDSCLLGRKLNRTPM